MEGPRPYKGASVIYQAHGNGAMSCDPEKAQNEWWPATVTKTEPDSMYVSLVYFYTGGLFFQENVLYDEGKSPRTWRWPDVPVR